MKTKLTKKIEYLIFKDTNKLGISGCREVKIGTQTLLLESFARSAARDANKLYELENTNDK